MSLFSRTTLRVLLLSPDAALPTRGHRDDAGLDLSSCEDAILAPGERATIHTGVAIEVPRGHVGLVCPRSSMNAAGITTPIGVVDAGYTGEILVTLQNDTGAMYRVKPRARVAQIVILPIAVLNAVEVESLPHTPRGTSGFGSTGV